MRHFYDFYERTSPIPGRGGIKARSQRGEFGQNWWSKRWIEVLESFHLGGRLTRGRSYARRGQVLSVDIERGVAGARVQGSRPTPYEVTIKIRPLPPEDWKKVTEVMSSQAIFAARLLAGEMPQEIESAFREAGVSLFPASMKEIETDCSCPDYFNPCKHIAAVYYLLGEEFDRDPFLIFKLRGLEREDLVRELGSAPKQQESPPPLPEPLPASPAAFWHGAPLPPSLLGDVRTPPLDAPLLRTLGPFPFWRGSESLMEQLEPVYREASRMGINVFLGEPGALAPGRERRSRR